MVGRTEGFDVVFGSSPVAVAIATHLGGLGSTVLAGARAVEGPFVWRSVDPSTGRGAKQALEGARRVFVATSTREGVDGLFVVLRRGAQLPGAVVLPLGVSAPEGLAECPGLARVHHGPAWGAEEPLVAAWSRTVAEGGVVWLPDPGPVRPVSLRVVTAGAVEAAARGPVRWSLAGAEVVQLLDLATEIGRSLGRPVRTLRVPVAWAAWRAGVSASEWASWVHTPVSPTVADGWSPPLVGRAGWVTPSGAGVGRGVTR